MKKVLLLSAAIVLSSVVLSASAQTNHLKSTVNEEKTALFNNGTKADVGTADLNGSKGSLGTADLNGSKGSLGTADLNGSKGSLGTADLNGTKHDVGTADLN